MSSVRMCDRYETVFSELEDGWQTFSAQTMKVDDEGRRVPITQNLDACPSCALEPPKVFRKELEAHAAGKEQEERIAKLEREVGLGT